MRIFIPVGEEMGMRAPEREDWDCQLQAAEVEAAGSTPAIVHHGKSSYPQISQIIATAQIYLNMPERLSPRRLRIKASMPPQ